MSDSLSAKEDESTRSSTSPRMARLKSAGMLTFHHLKKHTGVGVVCAVAYFDPGNWGVDLQAGSQFGYRLLFVVLLAGIFAVFLQVMASKLGCVTGIHLASHCRVLLYNRPKHPLLYRWLGLYPLYALAEIAIISTDLAELLGSAIALCLLFPRLQLWHGVLLTAFDVVFLLALGDPLRSRPLRAFEFFIAALVLIVLVCMVVIITKIEVDWGDAFFGYVPSKYIFKSGGLYTSVGILGATVMPHSLFIGSALSTQDRLSPAPPPEKSFFGDSKDTLDGKPISWPRRFVRGIVEFFVVAFRIPPRSSNTTTVRRHADRENNSLAFVKAHIYHGIADVMGSLLGFAVLINSLILMVASAVFFYGANGNTGTEDPASLFDTYDLIRDLVGQPAATLFAIALLSAGQSSSIIATVAGQAVSEGFLEWRVSPVVRRLLTRLIAVIPSMIVAIAIGRPGINALLVASQVVLSIVLPFITFPLIYLTSSKLVMGVRKPRPAPSPTAGEPDQVDGVVTREPAALEDAGDEIEDFSNSKIVTVIGCVIWIVIVAANMYVIISLAMGNEG